MTKRQRLQNIAEGILAGLVAVGFEGPFVWAHHEWEGPFYRAWRAWPPATRSPEYFRTFAVGGSADGRTSQARDILFSVSSRSPFHGFDSQPLNRTPMGLSPEEYLELWVQGATPEEWKDLARSLLEELPEPASSRTRLAPQ